MNSIIVRRTTFGVCECVFPNWDILVCINGPTWGLVGPTNSPKLVGRPRQPGWWLPLVSWAWFGPCLKGSKSSRFAAPFIGLGQLFGLELMASTDPNEPLTDWFISSFISEQNNLIWTLFQAHFDSLFSDLALLVWLCPYLDESEPNQIDLNTFGVISSSFQLSLFRFSPFSLIVSSSRWIITPCDGSKWSIYFWAWSKARSSLNVVICSCII